MNYTEPKEDNRAVYIRRIRGMIKGVQLIASGLVVSWIKAYRIDGGTGKYQLTIKRRSQTAL